VKYPSKPEKTATSSLTKKLYWARGCVGRGPHGEFFCSDFLPSREKKQLKYLNKNNV